MRMRKLLAALLMLLAVVMMGQSVKLKGRVLDASGLVMPGAQIRISQSGKAVAEATAGATGDFELAVAPGTYRIDVTAAEFQPFATNVNVTPATAPLTISLKLAGIAQNVNVTEDGAKVSVDADSSLTTTVLKQDFVDQLPTDENELAAYLQQIAGSRGDANSSGSFVIDGFSGGTLPPKDQIQEIRINNNPYSTEFSGVGFGRVEIITRAGTGTYHGNFNFNFRDDKLNAQIPFAPSKPPFQQRSFNSVFSGPIIRNKLTMNISGRNNYTDNSDTINAIGPNGAPITGAVLKPSVSRAIAGRGQWALTRNNTLNFSLNYDTNDSKNQGVGTFNLESRAIHRTNSGLDLQIRETAIITPALVHEVRFSYSLDKSNTSSTSQAFGHNVLDSFFDGGAQTTGNTRNQPFEWANLLMYSGKKWTVRTGAQVQYRKNHAFSQSNFVGSCTFSSLADFNANKPVTCSQTRGNPILDDGQVTLGTFIQNDWKLRRNFTLSFGVRYEAQTNIGDHNNVDPRVAVAYGLGQNTVIRLGAGVFHQRFDQGTLENLLRFDGTRQLQVVVQYPVYDPANPEAVFGNATTSPPSSIRGRTADLVTPYAGNTSISVERGLPKGMGVTLSWDTVRGVHLYRSRDINAPFPGLTLRPDPSRGIINDLESTGFSRSSNYTVGFRETLRNNWNLNLFGNYTVGWSRNDTDGPLANPMNNYDLRSDWGRAPQDMRQRFFSGANFRMPGNVIVNSSLSYNTGRPYNITTGRDENNDSNTNDRPAGVPRNSATGPSNTNVNLNLSKSVKLRRQEPSPASRAGISPFANSFVGQRGEGSGAGERGFGQPQGGGERGGDRGGGPAPGVGGSINVSGASPTMTLQANVNNLLNTSQFSNFSGVLTSTKFGRATSARNPRTVEMQLRFNF